MSVLPPDRVKNIGALAQIQDIIALIKPKDLPIPKDPVWIESVGKFMDQIKPEPLIGKVEPIKKLDPILPPLIEPKIDILRIVRALSDPTDLWGSLREITKGLLICLETKVEPHK